VAGAVVLAFLRPESWESIAGALAVAVAVGQVVYGALHGTGIFDWIGDKTEPKRAIESEPQNDLAD